MDGYTIEGKSHCRKRSIKERVDLIEDDYWINLSISIYIDKPTGKKTES